jgi:Xaa-Pro aminopeptidase
MSPSSPDSMVLQDDWSDLRRYREIPEIDFDRLHTYRMERIKSALREAEASMCVLVNPVSLRYAVDYPTYPLFQSHIPSTYLFVPVEGPVVIYGVLGHVSPVDDARPARAISYFEGGDQLSDAASLLADDLVDYLKEIGTDNFRVAVEYVNPTLTQALMKRGLDVIDGVSIAEQARVIKSEEEIACMRWAIAVSEHGISKMKEALTSGVTEAQLWGILNYTNLANHGHWHDGRMLASGPRLNPWFQEASLRQIDAGDLVGFDTDMIGPYGYCADISRTFHCGPGRPTKKQKWLYGLALQEIEHNLKLIRPGITFNEFQRECWVQAEEFHENAYVCVIHGVGMCDEYPQVKPIFRGPTPYDGRLETGMVICVESYVGAKGGREGVKLEQQVLVTDDGYDMLSTYPLEEELLD